LLIYYPDVFVTCARSAHRLYESDANIIVEIVSASNSPRELTEKLFEYQVAMGDLSVGSARLQVDAIFAEVDATVVAE
jgi:hypothetical protein